MLQRCETLRLGALLGVCRIPVAWMLLALVLALGPWPGTARAQDAAATSPPPTLEQKVDELQRLLADPDLRAALSKAQPPAEPASGLGGMARPRMDSALDRWVARMEAHVWAIISAARDLPSDLAHAIENAFALIGQEGWLRFLLSIAMTLGAAFGVERLCRRALANKLPPIPEDAGQKPDDLPIPAETAAVAEPLVAVPVAVEQSAPPVPAEPVAEPAPVTEAELVATPPSPLPPDEQIGVPVSPLPPAPEIAEPGPTTDPRQMERIANGMLPLAGFVLTVIVLHILLRGPDPLGPLVQPWLIAVMFVRVIRALVRLSFALPDAATRPEARGFWLRRITQMAVVFVGGWAISHSAGVLGAPMDCVILLRYLTGLALLIMTAVTLWRNPGVLADPAAGRKQRLFLTFWLALIALFEIAGALLFFWLAVYAVALPPLLRQVTRIVRGIVPQRTDMARGHAMRLVLLDRGARALVLIGAALWLAWLVRNDPTSRIMHEDTMGMIISGALRGVIILLLADLSWHVLSAMISDSLTRAAASQDPGALAKTARMRTLLPIFRSVAGAAILVIALMMVLAGMGVEIGPLIAGAGIFGVAIGFGSQTLVKDVISGIFYMIDDAFRVGEYIQSGSYRGVVEGFSLRSVRLRHHRGPVFTVPFGTLGAVQNMSRDWSKDKFLINVPFDTDIEKVRRLVKKVGQTLQEDPEFGPLFIQPIKMKGVEQFTDYGMTLAVAMILHPSPMLSTIRRRAYKMIRDAFQENGIDFASPTVQVAAHASDDEEGASDRAAALAAEQRRRAAEAAKAAGA
ncbi:mechanosensitive ion channel domain-containing protein [Paracoccus sp. NGMCC 1.201697]|uniref:Mechanosensitive ion channel domain-containing protein n=1 Tax=Paracoccus broussonetiae subsp. drimophilus TaxID=3373869 RepID=A0ABW7LLS3_9RHOB